MNTSAIVVGIDDYRHVAGRGNAVGAADAFRHLLLSAGVDEPVLLLDAEATRAAVLEALGGLRLTRARDCVIIFFAGRAVTVDRDDGSQEGFLLSADDGEGGGIGMESIRSLLAAVPARRLLLLLDAEVGGLMADAVPGQIVEPGRRGHYIIASGRQDTEEGSDPSLFARALLAAFHGHADEDGDGAVSAREMGSFVARSVPAMSGGRQWPSFRTFDAQPVDFVLPTPSAGRDDFDYVTGVPAAEREPATVQVSARPVNARVRIDHQPSRDTPTTTTVPPGEATIEVLLPGHAPWVRRVHLAPGETRRLDADLVQNEAYLNLLDLPPYATVHINERPIPYPEVTHHLSPGVHYVDIRQPGGRTKQLRLRLDAGTHHAVSAGPFGPPAPARTVPPTEQKPYGHLRVLTDVDSVLVIVDGNYHGFARIAAGDSLALPSGPRRVVFAVSEAPDYVFDARIAPDTTLEHAVWYRAAGTSHDAYLRSSSYPVLSSGANIYIRTDPDADVFVDGARAGRGSTALDLSAGRHLVETVHPLAGKRRQQVDIVEDPPRLQELELVVRPDRRKAMKLAAVPGASQWYQNQKARALLIAAAEAAGLYLAYTWHRELTDRRNDFTAIRNSYEWETRESVALELGNAAEAAHKAVREASDRRGLWLGLSAGVYALSFLDALRPPGSGFRPQPAARLALLPADTGTGLTLRLQIGKQR